MNILFLTLGKINSIEDKSVHIDLMRTFKEKGHNVYITCASEKRMNLETNYTQEKGINILRVKIGNITKTNLVEKGISTVNIERLFLKSIKKYMSNVKFDLIVYSTPPITFEKVIKYLKKRDNPITYLLLKDIFPQNAVDLNMIKENGIIHNYFRRKEKKLYRISDYIGCMSQGNKEYLLRENPEINSEIVEVCPNSIQPVFLSKDFDEVKRIRKKYDIPSDRVIAIYGGNLGKPQGIDFLIKCIDANKNNYDIYFIIAGSGTEFVKLKRYFEINKPGNAKLFHQLPKEDYEILANSCDIGLIFLDYRFTIPNIPARLLSYMQSSIPIYAVTDKNTDLSSIIEDGKFGYWSESNDLKNFNKTLRLFMNENERKQMGKNARDFLEKNYTTDHSYEIIMKNFK